MRGRPIALPAFRGALVGVGGRILVPFCAVVHRNASSQIMSPQLHPASPRCCLLNAGDVFLVWSIHASYCYVAAGGLGLRTTRTQLSPPAATLRLAQKSNNSLRAAHTMPKLPMQQQTNAIFKREVEVPRKQYKGKVDKKRREKN